MPEAKEKGKRKMVMERKEREKEGGQRPSGFTIKKKRQFQLGTVALQETGKLQKSTRFLIRKLSFARWVRRLPKNNGVMSGFRYWLSSPYKRWQKPISSICLRILIY